MTLRGNAVDWSDTLTQHLNAPPRPPDDTLKEILRRFESFDLQSSIAKTLLIDARS